MPHAAIHMAAMVPAVKAVMAREGVTQKMLALAHCGGMHALQVWLKGRGRGDDEQSKVGQSAKRAAQGIKVWYEKTRQDKDVPWEELVQKRAQKVDSKRASIRRAGEKKQKRVKKGSHVSSEEGRGGRVGP